MRLIADDALAIATIWQEARGESYRGKLAVARVIRNRMARRYQSDGTVEGTVLAPYQFSGWNTRDPNRIGAMRLDDTDPVVRDCQLAWEESREVDPTNSALLYYNPKIVPTPPEWAKPLHARETSRIGDHVFFVPLT
jgi:N-acetylmuramoyl-L-alanine amidase